MKYLQISGGKGFFRKEQAMVELDRLTKLDMLALIESADLDGFEMDDYDADLLQNRAHRIIYENLFNKLSEFRAELNSFRDKAERLYLEAVNQYGADISSEALDKETFSEGDNLDGEQD